MTPPVGARMGGFGGRTHGAVGIHDPLRAKAIAVGDGQASAMIITCDLISFSYDFVAEISGLIQKRCGLAPDHVLINTSHTHSGPLHCGPHGLGEPDAEYARNLAADLAGLAEMALNSMQPVTITSHQAALQVGINRRERMPNGSTKLGRNPDLIVDRNVDVLKFTAPDGRVPAVFFSHAAHGVVLGGNNYLFSADWMGYAQRTVEHVYPGTIAAFGQGCCGNINSDPVGGTFEDARRLGTRAAGAVMMALESPGLELEPRVAARKVSAMVPQLDPPPVAETERVLAQHLQKWREAEAAGKAASSPWLKAMVDWATWRRDQAVAGRKDNRLRFDISAVALGQHALVGLAGEVFFEYAVNIAASSPFARTTTMGTANGCICYLPTAAEIPFGGYEIEGSMIYYWQLRLRPECEQVVLAEAARLLQQLRG
ncbi:MAG: neutral/alkaline non-lysosomal ceramidase N-terminal domain-containing protein [Planctomycetes bacterium]|nr:neutral/alkaline non-lysosomal ceramidase N-terminal domain-containing protein [Planctomycetota bacterium]